MQTFAAAIDATDPPLLLAALCFAAGMLALVLGYRLFTRPTAQASSAQPSSLGAMIMASSVLWGGLGWSLAPTESSTHAAPSALAVLSEEALQAARDAPQGTDLLTESIDQPRAWNAIVIHFSGQTYSDGNLIHRQHRLIDPAGGLGCHFVIGNGRASQDGAVQVGPRWIHQQEGFAADAQHHSEYATNEIGICLVGTPDQQPTASQMQQLIRLTVSLQKRFRIPFKSIRVVKDSNSALYAGDGLSLGQLAEAIQADRQDDAASDAPPQP